MASENSDDFLERSQLEGRYANYFEVGHTAFEFLLDFGQVYQNDAEKHVHTRIITGPNYVKALFELLGESIDRYERIFGTIQGD